MRDEVDEVLETSLAKLLLEQIAIGQPISLSQLGGVMEARGYRQKDLATVIGSQPHASEVLNRRRPLTVPMIRALSAEWKLPADILVREYDLAAFS